MVAVTWWQQSWTYSLSTVRPTSAQTEGQMNAFYQQYKKIIHLCTMLLIMLSVSIPHSHSGIFSCIVDGKNGGMMPLCNGIFDGGMMPLFKQALANGGHRGPVGLL